MKTQMISCALAAFMHLAPGAALSWDQAEKGQPASLAGITLDVRPDCSRCLPGEPLRVTIRARNLSATAAVFPSAADVWEGHISLFVAFEEGPFKEYRGPGWGLRDVAPGTLTALTPGQAFTTEATILFNEGIRTSHLSATYSGPISARQLSQGYALGRAGRYRIKAVLYDDAFIESVESSPAEVRVDEPEGSDAEVWTVLRANPELGYFIQSGSSRGRSSSDASERLIDLAERLAADHPSSRYAEALRVGASKGRAMLDSLRARGLYPH